MSVDAIIGVFLSRLQNTMSESVEQYRICLVVLVISIELWNNVSAFVQHSYEVSQWESCYHWELLYSFSSDFWWMAWRDPWLNKFGNVKIVSKLKPWGTLPISHCSLLLISCRRYLVGCFVQSVHQNGGGIEKIYVTRNAREKLRKWDLSKMRETWRLPAVIFGVKK